MLAPPYTHGYEYCNCTYTYTYIYIYIHIHIFTSIKNREREREREKQAETEKCIQPPAWMCMSASKRWRSCVSMYVYICRCAHRSILCTQIYLSTHPSIHLSYPILSNPTQSNKIQSILSYPSIYLPTYLSIHPLSSLSTYAYITGAYPINIQAVKSADKAIWICQLPSDNHPSIEWPQIPKNTPALNLFGGYYKWLWWS